MTQIIFDCDDVLLDWSEGFRHYASVRMKNPVKGKPKSWKLGEWLGTSDEVAAELVEEFNSSIGFGRLSPVEGATAFIDHLIRQRTENSTPYRLHVVTSCSSDEITVARRRKNLELVFGEGVFDSIHCLDLGQSKFNVLQAWAPGAIWIEDNYKNAIAGAQLGHWAHIRRLPHNAEFQNLHDPRLTWFDTWTQLKEHI